MKVIINSLITRPNNIEINIDNNNISVIDLKRKICEQKKINILNEIVVFNKAKKKDNDILEFDKDYEILIVKNFSI